MRTNYVLIDYESVQPDSLAVVDHEHFKTYVFIGANQTRVPTDFAAALQRMKAAKPRTVKTLSSTISALFQKQLPEKEIEALVKALHKQALIAVDGKKVSYTLP